MASKTRRTDGISFRDFDSAWYSSVSGKYAPLRDEVGNKIKGRENEAKAKKAYHLAALESGQVATSDISIGQVFDRYLDYCKSDCSPEHYTTAKSRLTEFAGFVGDTRLASTLRRHELRNWIDSKKAWGANVTNCATQVVITAVNFAIERGWCKVNPFSKMKRPPQEFRVSFFSVEQEQAIMEASAFSPEFQDFFRFLISTGCRPSEASKIEAQFCRETPQGMMVELAQHKTRKKTGRSKIITCGQEATAILRRLIVKTPQGKLFSSSKGNDYGTKRQAARATWRIVRKRVQDAKGKDFLPDSFVLYSARHTFATRCLAKGLSIAFVAALLGNSPMVCSRVYGHLEQVHSVLFTAVNSLSKAG